MIKGLRDGAIVTIDHTDPSLGRIQTNAEVRYFDNDEVKVAFRHKGMYLGIFVPHSSIKAII